MIRSSHPDGKLTVQVCEDLHGIFPYLYSTGENCLSKDLFNCKMEVNMNNLKVIVKQGVKTKKDLNKGKRLNQIK